MTEKIESPEELGYDSLVVKSEKFQRLAKICDMATKTSPSGITNLVVNFEDPSLIDSFLNFCFKSTSILYNETFGIDAVELQGGRPGIGNASAFLDQMIYGTIEVESSDDGLGSPVLKTDAQTGARRRKADGFVNRREVLDNTVKDKTLIIWNLDFCMDFCHNKPGVVDATNLGILDNFRDPEVKQCCRILLVTNVKLKLPFQIRVVEVEPVDDYEAVHILDGVFNHYRDRGYTIDFSKSQRRQVIRKLSGLTYTNAVAALTQATSVDSLKEFDSNEVPDDETADECKKRLKTLDEAKVLKNLRESINKSFMEDASGLTHLTAKPWGDYICSDSSNFTTDVNKILRDFEEIEILKQERVQVALETGNDDEISDLIDAIRSRIPRVFVLTGRGGVGKSAFPIHFAGLLDFDVWDFNINATHSKWIGEGSENMRKALQKINKTSHIVVRIDEYDRAIGSTTGSGQGMHEAHKQVESEFMNWLQNNQEKNFFVKNDVFIVLTTNHKENITGPLLRTGRADLVIDIADFDEDSVKEAFISSPKRMRNKGELVVNCPNEQDLVDKLALLDIDQISGLAAAKGFTVADVELLIQEMASHDYYYRKGKMGIPWTTEFFVKVLEESQGSSKEEDTCEMILGDRGIMHIRGEEDKKDDGQSKFEFYENCAITFDETGFKEVDFFAHN